MEKVIEGSIFVFRKIIAFLMLSLIVIISIQIFGRSVVQISTHWTEEVAKYILIWMTFLGSPVVLYKGEHLIVDLFYIKFSPRVRHIVRLFSDVFILVFCSYLVYFGIELCTNKFVLNFTSPAAGIPRVYIYSALPVGAVFMVIYSIWSILGVILIMLGKKEDNTARSIVDESKTLEEIDLAMENN